MSATADDTCVQLLDSSDMDAWPDTVDRLTAPVLRAAVDLIASQERPTSWKVTSWLLTQGHGSESLARHLVHALAPALEVASARDFLALLGQVTWRPAAVAMVAHMPEGVGLEQAAAVRDRREWGALLQERASAHGLDMDTFEWLVQARLPQEALPRCPVRVTRPEELAAAVSASADGSAERHLASWLVRTAQPALAAELLDMAASPSVDSERAVLLLDAGAALPAVVAAGRRWSKPDWHSDRRLTVGAAQYAGARDLAMLALDDELLASFLSRDAASVDLPTLLSVTMSERCRPSDPSIRVELLVRVVRSTARQKTLLVTLPWPRRGDALLVRERDAEVADELDRLLVELAYMRAAIGSDALLAERIAELDMDWALVRNPKAHEHAFDFLEHALGEGTREHDTARALLEGWHGTLRQLVLAARVV